MRTIKIKCFGYLYDLFKTEAEVNKWLEENRSMFAYTPEVHLFKNGEKDFGAYIVYAVDTPDKIEVNGANEKSVNSLEDPDEPFRFLHYGLNMEQNL